VSIAPRCCKKGLGTREIGEDSGVKVCKDPGTCCTNTVQTPADRNTHAAHGY
jgi:hypothetical protein